MLADIHERLAGVVIEQLPFDQFIARYDRPGMLFYLDPPYWGVRRTMARTCSPGRTSRGWPRSSRHARQIPVEPQ
jgi:site-specific DNA-adenine methylase